ncbi:alpha/beta hydrolase [Aestuariibius sp. 2305UL40-4]|uniref:alpha/beta hydrolase n=1 Tax=Aestuariibius violaceus TaxID=3234132 RepID=UPI00345E7E58
MFEHGYCTVFAGVFVSFATGLSAQDIGPSDYGIDLNLRGELLRPQQAAPTLPNGFGVRIDNDSLDLISPRELPETMLSPGTTISDDFTFDLNDPLRDNRPVTELDPALQALIFTQNRDLDGLAAIAGQQEVIERFGSDAPIDDILQGLEVTQSQPISTFTPDDIRTIIAQQPQLTDTARAVVWSEFLNQNIGGYAYIGLANSMAFAPEPVSESFGILLAQSDSSSRDELMVEWLNANPTTSDPRALGALYDQSYEGFSLPQVGLTPLTAEEVLSRLAPVPPGADPFADHLRARIESDQGNLESALAAFNQVVSAENPPASAFTDFANFSAQNPQLSGVLSDEEIINSYLDGFVGGDFDALQGLGSYPNTPNAVIIAATAQALVQAETPQERAIAAQQERNLCAAYGGRDGGPCEAPSMIYFTNRAEVADEGYSNEPASNGEVHFGHLNVPLLSELHRRRDDLGRWGARSCVTETRLAQRVFDCDQDIARNATDAGPLQFDVAEVDAFSEMLKPSNTGTTEQQAVVYIHGFNNSLEDAARDFARIILTARLHGSFQPILVSWPSQATAIFDTSGRLSLPVNQYRLDRSRVRDACQQIKGALLDIRNAYGNENVHIIVHSMGSYMLHQVLNGCPSADDANTQLQGTIAKNITFLAADLATSVFEADRELILSSAKRVTIYVAPSDPVLEFSSSLERLENGPGDGPRLGSGYDTLANTADDRLMVVNTLFSEFVETASGPTLYNTNHSYHINTPAVRRDISMLLRGHVRDQAERCLAPSDDILDGTDDHPTSYFIVPNCL